MYETELLIQGKLTASSNGGSFDCINPIDKSVATKAAAANIEDANKAASAAAEAFPEWSVSTPKERREYLLKASQALKDNQDALIEAMKAEIGATAAWAGFNVMLAADMLTEAASLTTQIKGEIIPTNRPGSTSMVFRQPIGVCLAMAPWNAPIILGVRSVATAIACGNTVVMKVSELCPKTHMLIAETINSTGLPKGVLNAISNAPEDAHEIVEALISHPAIRHVNFTGSTRVGRIIAETAGRNLKPVLLELGGKAPFIVLDDADIDEAVSAAGFGAFMNQGQICMSTERIIVLDEVADEFVAKFSNKVESLTAGDPREGTTPLGSLVSDESASRVTSLIEDALQKGGRLIGGKSANGTILDAAAIDHVNPTMRLYSEESFGPVVSIIRAANDEEALRIANESEFGLSAAVFSTNYNRALSLARRIESGICHINGPTVHDEAQIPFGGVKASGYGRFGGVSGIEEFTEVRWVTSQDGPLHYPI